MADVVGSGALPAGMRLSPFKPAALSLAAVRWLDDLPEHVRPDGTAARFPHIVNTLCMHWATQQSCLAYFDDLLIDDRGNRTGFPPNVARELARLKDHYETVVFPTNQTIWDELLRPMRGDSTA